MSRIDQLIEDLCPDGVKNQPISKVGTFIRGGGLRKKTLLMRALPVSIMGKFIPTMEFLLLRQTYLLAMKWR